MANWIATQIELTGNREVLERIEKAINQCNDNPRPEDGSENNWVGYILELLNINTKKWARDRAFWYHAHFNKHGHLVFREDCAWKRSNCAEALKPKFPQEISGINYHYMGWY